MRYQLFSLLLFRVMIQISPSFRESQVINAAKSLAATCTRLGCQEIADGLDRFTHHASQNPKRVSQLRGASNALFSFGNALNKVAEPIKIFNRAIPNAEFGLIKDFKIDVEKAEPHHKYPSTNITFDANPWINKVSAKNFLAVDAKQYPTALPILYQAYLYTKYALDDYGFDKGLSAPQLKPTITHRLLDRERFAFAFTRYLTTILERANDADRAEEIEALFHVTGMNIQEANSSELTHTAAQGFFQENFTHAREEFIQALKSNNPSLIKNSLQNIENLTGLANSNRKRMISIGKEIGDETFNDLSIDFTGLYRFLLLDPFKQFIDSERIDNHKAQQLAKEFAMAVK